MPSLFKATKKQLPEPSIGDLSFFLEAYINLQFPKNDIHRWIDGHGSKDIQKSHLISRVTGSVQHNANNDVIGVTIACKDNTVQRVCFAESEGGNTKKNTIIAQAIADVVKSIYLYHESPLIVDFSNRLPGDSVMMKGECIRFFYDDTTLDIVVNDHPVAVYDFTDNGESASQDVMNHLDDWNRLASNLKMNRSSINKSQEHEHEDESSFSYM